MSEAALIKQAVHGDGDALAALLARYGPKVERSLKIDRVWRAVLDPADVMQVSYLEAYLQIDRFNEDQANAFEAWLRRIAQNNLRDAIRGLARQKNPQPRDRVHTAPGNDSIAGLVNLLGVTTTTPSRNVRLDEACQALQLAIETLPEDYARAVQLYDLDNRPIDEVARALGRSCGAVHMLRARAHERLRDQLGAASMFFSKGS